MYVVFFTKVVPHPLEKKHRNEFTKVKVEIDIWQNQIRRQILSEQAEWEPNLENAVGLFRLGQGHGQAKCVGRTQNKFGAQSLDDFFIWLPIEIHT